MATSGLWIAVPAALVGAAGYGLAGALQHQATHQVRHHHWLSPSLLFDLVRQPLWLISIVASAAGLGLQLVALSWGPLVLVQPILVTGLLFAILIGAAASRRRPDRVVILGSLLCMFGLAGFLLAARPQGGGGTFSAADALFFLITLAAIVALCLVGAAHTGVTWRPVALAVAAGVLYGVMAGVAKIIVGQLEHGLTEPLLHWHFYIFVVLAPVGFLLNQNAFQEGRMAAPAVAVITAADPLVSIGIGILWLHESIQGSALAVTIEVLSLAGVVGGIAVLAGRAPQVVKAG